MEPHDPSELRWRLPVFRSLDGYRWDALPRDLTAGILIVALAIPLSMGMAEVAGVPPIVGLYSCILPLIAYAAFGSSRQLVISLDATTAAMVATADAPLAGADPARYVALASVLALLVGAVLISAGALRIGAIARLLSRPVLLGYQAALAVVVIAAQLPKIFGFALERERPLDQLVEIGGRVGETDMPTLAIGVGAIAVVVGIARIKRGLPGALVAIVGATLAVEAFGRAFGTVAVVGDLPAGLPRLGVPAVGTGDLLSLLPAATAIAVVAAADTIVSSRAFADRNGYRVDANRDLIGLGAANLSSGMSGGISTSASAARTAVVEMVGGRSQLASVAAAALMACVLLFLTGPLERVPIAALAAVVAVAVIRLIELPALRDLWRTSRIDFAIAMVTIAVSVTVGLLHGIVVGVLMSVGANAARGHGRRPVDPSTLGSSGSSRPATVEPARP
jgi:MFS superfamily sulfate permease-like transporter